MKKNFLLDILKIDLSLTRFSGKYLFIYFFISNPLFFPLSLNVRQKHECEVSLFLNLLRRVFYSFIYLCYVWSFFLLFFIFFCCKDSITNHSTNLLFFNLYENESLMPISLYYYFVVENCDWRIGGRMENHKKRTFKLRTINNLD